MVHKLALSFLVVTITQHLSCHQLEVPGLFHRKFYLDTASLPCMHNFVLYQSFAIVYLVTFNLILPTSGEFLNFKSLLYYINCSLISMSFINLINIQVGLGNGTSTNTKIFQSHAKLFKKYNLPMRKKVILLWMISSCVF